MAGCQLAVWAPNAKRVWVIGSFNDWNETSHEMKRLEPNGIYELFISNVKIGDMYKYLIETQDGRKLIRQILMQTMRNCVRALHQKSQISVS